MAVTPLSAHFFYFLLINEVPDDFKPVLQVMQARHVGDKGMRLRLFDGQFTFSSVFVSDESTMRILEPAVDGLQPKIRVSSYNIPPAEKAVLYIDDVTILDVNCPPPQDNARAIGDPLHFADYIKVNGISLIPTFSTVEAKPAKRPRVEPSFGGVSAALNSYRSPTKKSISTQSPSKKQVTNGENHNVTPFGLLTPFVNKWRICGLVVSKESTRDINHQRGAMKVMSFILVEDTGKMIKCSAWNEAADDFNSRIFEGQTYYITGDQGCIKKRNARFNFTDHDYELSLTPKCTIEICTDRVIEAPKFKIKRIMLANINKDFTKVDVLTVVDKIGEITNLIKRVTSEPLKKRDYVLVDNSNASINLTVWGDKADDVLCTEGDVMAIKNAVIKEYMGSLSLSLVNASSIEINPDENETRELYNWYENVRPNVHMTQLSVAGSNFNFIDDLRTLASIKLSSMADVPSGIYSNAKVIIQEVKKENAYYPACEKCNKKVVQNEGGYQCPKCSTRCPYPKMRYMLTLLLADETDSVYVTLFDDQAYALLRITAQELDEIRRESEDKYNAKFEPLLFKSVVVRMKSAVDYYNDQKRLKHTVHSVRQIPIPQYQVALDTVLNVLEKL